MKERFDYGAIQEQPKKERRKAVLDSGILDKRRFLLPPDSVVRERIRILRNSVEEFKHAHSEVVSFGLFGSNTKAYATQESDLDGALYVDLRAAIAAYREHHPPASPKEMMDGVKSDLKSQFRELLVQNAGIKAEQVADVVVRFVDVRTTRTTLRAEKMDVRAIKDLFVLFLLQVGSGIEEYRRTVLDELDRQGEVGEEKWQIISARLAKFENTTRERNSAVEGEKEDEDEVKRRQHLYPQNLKDARRIFLKERDHDVEAQELEAAA
jgi:hypothetical protein